MNFIRRIFKRPQPAVAAAAAPTRTVPPSSMAVVAVAQQPSVAKRLPYRDFTTAQLNLFLQYLHKNYPHQFPKETKQNEDGSYSIPKTNYLLPLKGAIEDPTDANKYIYPVEVMDKLFMKEFYKNNRFIHIEELNNFNNSYSKKLNNLLKNQSTLPRMPSNAEDDELFLQYIKQNVGGKRSNS